MHSTNNPGVAPGREFVSYMDLSGGLNTYDDQHAIDRNQLALSQNAWYGFHKSVGKRPGTVAIVTPTGATGTGIVGTNVVVGRFGGISYALSQQGTILEFASIGATAYTSISTALGLNAGRISAAQMYDPTTPTTSTADGSMFICDGIDVPKIWLGPGHTSLSTVNTSAGFLPVNYAGTSAITPKYVLADGQNSNIVYAGEPTFPTAVYISDPSFPEKFSFSASNLAPGSYSGSYSPYVVGMNDGVNGGDITGMAKLGTTLVIFKQSAIYFMQLQSVYANLVFTDFCVSWSTGCVAPQSIVAFDQFVCFLGVDGAYTVDIYGNVQQITRGIPTFFDNTVSGFPAVCTSKSTAVGVRSGSRYLLFYDGANAGYPNRGLWFDFSKLDRNQLPTTGEILGYNLAGAATLNGPNDDGRFVWTDAMQDRLGIFGLGFSDFGLPITTNLQLKADMLAEEFGQRAPVTTKALVNMWLDVAIPAQANAVTLQFFGSITTDYLDSQSVAASQVVTQTPLAAWGHCHWGAPVGPNDVPPAGHWGAPQTQSEYFTTRIPGLQSSQGRIIQLGVLESSTNPWTLLGITGEFDDRNVQT